MVLSILENSVEDPVFLSGAVQDFFDKYTPSFVHQELETNRRSVSLYNNYPAFYYKQEGKGSYCLAGLGQVAMYLAAMTNGGGGGHKKQWAVKSSQGIEGMWHPIAYEQTHPEIQRISDTITSKIWNMDCLASY